MTDELQANQSLLRDIQHKVEHLKNLMGSLQEQVDTLKQEVRTHMYMLAEVDTGRNTYRAKAVIYLSKSITIFFHYAFLSIAIFHIQRYKGVYNT